MPTIPDTQPGCKPPPGGTPRAAPTPAPSRARAFAAITLAAMIAAALALALRNPVDVLGSGGCPTRRFAGLYCPGCGSLRATHHTLNGRLALAWRHNPALVAVGLPAAACLAAVAAATLVTGRSPRPPFRLRAVHLWIAAALLTAWGLIRNIPSPLLDWARPPDARYDPRN